MKHRIAISILTAALTFSLVGNVNAERPRLSKPSKRVFDIRPTNYILGVKFHAGIVTGEAADEIDDYSSDFTDKMVYGLGLLTEYKFKTSVAIGLNFEYGWKTPIVSGMKSINFYSYAGNLTYSFSPNNRSSFFVRSDLGLSHFQYEDYDLGTHPYLRLGLGQSYATGPTTVARFELYYKHHFSEGHELTGTSGIWYSEIPFNIDWFGLEITFGFGL